MIGAKVSIPVENIEGEYSVRTITTGENKLESSLTDAIHSQAFVLQEILLELRLLNGQIEVAFDTGLKADDIEQSGL
jgi:hypothetical protein